MANFVKAVLGTSLAAIVVSALVIMGKSCEQRQQDMIQHQDNYVKVVEIHDAPPGVRCFVPQFYGTSASHNSGIACIATTTDAGKD